MVAFNGEEYLPIGDDEYVRRAGEASFGDIPLAINMDGSGYAGGQQHRRPVQHRAGAGRHGWPRSLTCYPTVQCGGSVAAEQPLDLLLPRRAGAGVQRRRAPVDLAHFPADTVAQVSVEKLAEIVSVVSQIVAAFG